MPEAVFEAVVSAAASVMAALEAGRPGRDVETGLICAGTELTRDPLALLASVQPAPASHLQQLSDLLARASGELTGCVLVTAAWDEARRELQRRLRQRGLEAMVLLVVDDAAAPPADAGATRVSPYLLRPGSLGADLARVGRAAAVARVA